MANLQATADWLHTQYGIRDDHWGLDWAGFSDEVLDAAEVDFAQSAWHGGYPWDNVVVHIDGRSHTVPRYAVVKRALREKKLQPWMKYNSVVAPLYEALTITLLHKVFKDKVPSVRVRFVLHGHMFGEVMPRAHSTVYYEYSVLPTSGEPVPVYISEAGDAPAIMFSSDCIAAAHSGANISAHYASETAVREELGSFVKWPWFLVDFDEFLANPSAAERAPSTSDPNEVIEFNGVTATRMEHVRNALRAADTEAVEALGYKPNMYRRYSSAALLQHGSQPMAGRRLVPHPAPCSPKAVGFLRDVGGFHGECPRVMFRPNGEEEGVAYDEMDSYSQHHRIRLGTNSWRSYRIEAPWWMMDFIPESPEVILERRRKRAKARLEARIEAWDSGRHVRRGPLSIKEIKDAGNMFGTTRRHTKLATGRAFEWARSQRDWPAVAVHSVVLDYNTEVKNWDRLYNKTTQRADRFAREKLGTTGLAPSYSVFEYVWKAHTLDPDKWKQDKNRPWEGHSITARAVPWYALPCGTPSVNPMVMLHAVQPAKEDPMKVAFYKSFNDWCNAKRTVMKPGRYLKKYFGLDSPDACIPWLTDDEVRVWAEKWEELHRPVEVHFKENTDPDGWEWVYRNESGFESCMSAHKYERNGPKAVRAYAHPENNLALAYLLNSAGDAVVARCIVNKAKKAAGRVYGDSRLRNALVNLGYAPEVGGLIGEKLSIILVPGQPGKAYMPYLDYGTEPGGGATAIAVSEDATHFVVVKEHDGYRAANYDTATVYMTDVLHRNPYLVANVPDAWRTSGDDDDDDDDSIVECDDCGGSYNEDEMYYSTYHDRRVCHNCIDDYVRAYVGPHDVDLVRTEDTVVHNDTYYADDGGVLAAHDLMYCAHSGDLCHIDDVVEVVDGSLVGMDYATPLDIPHIDEYGNEYHFATNDETVETTDGDIIYQDDAVDLEDGRTYHSRYVVQWEDGSMHHEDDERPDDEDQDTDVAPAAEPAQQDNAPRFIAVTVTA